MEDDKRQTQGDLVYEERDVLSWKSMERVYKMRGKEFFSTVVVLALLVSVILFFIEGLMPVLVIWAIFFVVWSANRTPPVETDHRLTTLGIRTGGSFFRFSEMKQAWVEEKYADRVLRIVLMKFPWQASLIIKKEDERKIIELLADKGVVIFKPDQTKVERLVKWLGEKIPLEES